MDQKANDKLKRRNKAFLDDEAEEEEEVEEDNAQPVKDVPHVPQNVPHVPQDVPHVKGDEDDVDDLGTLALEDDDDDDEDLPDTLGRIV